MRSIGVGSPELYSLLLVHTPPLFVAVLSVLFVDIVGRRWILLLCGLIGIIAGVCLFIGAILMFKPSISVPFSRQLSAINHRHYWSLLSSSGSRSRSCVHALDTARGAVSASARVSPAEALLLLSGVALYNLDGRLLLWCNHFDYRARILSA